MSEIRVMPLPKVTGVYDHDMSRYPDRIRIPMSDWKVVTYHIDVEMPHPIFEAAMKNLSNMKRAGAGGTATDSREKLYRAHCSTQRGEK